MEQWLESIYSDGSSLFVEPPQPDIGDEVKVRIRMYENAPVENVFVRTNPNGEQHLVRAEKIKTEKGFDWYEATFKMIQPRMHYHFYIQGKDKMYFYNQKEITTYIPDHIHDFRLAADYKQPKWVKESVFYQIFPERFANGNPEWDVKDHEYEMNGHPSVHMEWNEKPLQYEEGHCMDFFGGDLKGIEDKIPYLKELGVNAIYLNPIFTAPSTHKYDCIDYLQVDPHLGGDEALASLSKALHENGMKLILDISINHTGMNHRWFNKEGLYFDKSVGAFNNPECKERNYYFFEPDSDDYIGWHDVETLPALNYTSEELKDIIYRSKDSVLKKWLNPPYNIDGWRFDVADVFARHNELQLADEIWPEITKSIKEENPQAYILAEDWDDCSSHLQGDEWDSPMNYFGCGRVLRSFAGLTDGFAFRDPSLLELPYKMSAKDVRNRIEQHLSKIPWAIAQNQFNLIDSHDVARLHNYDIDEDLVLGMVLLQFMLPGTPSIYYGDEAKIDGWVENNEGCRFPMPWDKDFKEDRFYGFYKDLAHLKRETNALKEGGMKFLYDEGRILSLARFDNQEAFIVIVSGEEQDQEIELSLGAIGASLPEKRDYFNQPLEYEVLDDKKIRLKVPAGKFFLIRTPLID